MTLENGDHWLLLGPIVFIKQRDSHNCGSNSTLNIVSVFGAIPEDTVVEMLKRSET
jgi:hypothetical protein